MVILRISSVYCDSSDWEQQWIQGAPLSKQPDWFKNNTEDPRSLYEQINGPRWHNVKDYYYTENSIPKYADYGYSSSSKDTSLADFINSMRYFVHTIEMKYDLDDVEPEYYCRKYRKCAPDTCDYTAVNAILKQMPTDLWRAKTEQDLYDPDSDYNIALRFIDDCRNTARENNDIFTVELLSNLYNFMTSHFHENTYY